MPASTTVKSTGPIGGPLSSMATHSTTTAVQSGPYTKAQFQSTMEGSRTIKSSKEIEQLLRDYPAALELYRTGKYKVKVKCEADVERVILVEKRTPKTMATTNNTKENNPTVADNSSNVEKDTKRQSRSRTKSQDRIDSTTTAPAENDANLVPATISSIHVTNNTQPKVDHHRTPSRDREVSVTPPQKQLVHRRSHSRDSHHQHLFNNQQGTKMNREYQKMIAPYVPNTSANSRASLWQQQQRAHQPYFSNPLLQQQQRANLYMSSHLTSSQNPIYQQPFFYGQRPSAPPIFPQQQSNHPISSLATIGKSNLSSTNNYTSPRSVFNTTRLPPSFRTFHANQQQQQQQQKQQQPLPPFGSMYPLSVPFHMNNHSRQNELPTSAMNNNVYGDVQRGAKNRARSVDTGHRHNLPLRPSIVQQPPGTFFEHFHHYHHHHHHTHRPHPTDPSTENGKEQNVPTNEPTNVANNEKLTVRQLNDTFTHANPSGRLPYNSLPSILQRFGITLTENDLTSAAKELEYNINEPVSARRLIHILVKLGKITKSTRQQQRQPLSPSMLPEDREVTDIMTQNKMVATTNVISSNQPNQWH